jgi:hypothetical protein
VFAALAVSRRSRITGGSIKRFVKNAAATAPSTFELATARSPPTHYPATQIGPVA